MKIENGILKLGGSGGFQNRGGTAATLKAVNPVLKAREIMIETDTACIKIGDGVKHWEELPYFDLSGLSNTILSKIGDLDELSTTQKGNLVSAINEVVEEPYLNYYNYRNKYLGETITAEQSASIRNGSFKGLCLGGYWKQTIPFTDSFTGERITAKIRMRIADFDYKRRDAAHYVLILPDCALYRARFNDTETTENGYAGSKIFTTYLEGAAEAFKTFFGEEHVLPYTIKTTGNNDPENPSFVEIPDRICDLLDLNMIFGSAYARDLCDTCLSAGQKNAVILESYNEQLMLFKLNPKMRDVKNSASEEEWVGTWSVTRNICGATQKINLTPNVANIIGAHRTTQDEWIRPYAFVY